MHPSRLVRLLLAVLLLSSVAPTCTYEASASTTPARVTVAYRGRRPCAVWATLQAYSIVVHPAATAEETFAVGELRHWLGNLTVGASAAETGHRRENNGAIVVGSSAALDAGLSASTLAALEPDEGFVATARGTEYILSGASNSTRGTLYAVYYFLRSLGLRFLAPDAVYVPRGADECPTSLPLFNVTVRPRIKHRRVESWGTVAAPLYALRSWLNGPTFAPPGQVFGPIPVAGLYASPPGFVHTSYRLLTASGVAPGAGPPPLLFKHHPSWFWPRNSATVAGQLCWSNTSLVDHIIANVRGFLRRQPSAEVISVSQNDNLNYCKSAEEMQIMAEEGGAPSGPLLRAVNRIADAIAEEFPRVVVSTLAYEYSRRPPALTRPRRNVAVR